MDMQSFAHDGRAGTAWACSVRAFLLSLVWERTCRAWCRCAGVFPSRMQVTEDGFEETWAVNVLAPFVINAMLVQHVRERIINVSSISADSRIDFGNLNQVCRRTSCLFHVARAGHAWAMWTCMPLRGSYMTAGAMSSS